jgi:predicted short-subunit dehydrogenase-like oxidoreductase (DUF2520 family)
MEIDTSLATLGRVGLIGAGALGSALARAFAARGMQIVAVAARHPDRAQALASVLPSTVAVLPLEVVLTCESVFLAISDDAIPDVAIALPWLAGQRVVHLSGARGTDVLAPAAARGALVAALHPLMTFPRVDLSAPVSNLLARLRGVTWALEADDTPLERDLTTLVAHLDGALVRLRSADRVAYHTAAVLASNYIVVLLGAAVRIWESIGLDGEAALAALLPLLRGSVEKLAQDGLPDALSGPIARGDAGTIAAHLAWLDAQAAGNLEDIAVRDAYRALARLAIPLAEAKGSLTPAAADRLRDMVE